MDTLILTGWGWKEYAVAAAAALRALDGRADVLGMSKRRLPEFLETEGANWVAMSGDGMEVYQAAQYTIDNGAVCRWNSVSGKLIYEGTSEESGYALSFFTEEKVDKVRFFKAVDFPIGGN